jgi:hypothetical protein
MAEEQHEQINLPTVGALPGIPGIHGPGVVIIHTGKQGERRVLTAEEWRKEQQLQSIHYSGSDKDGKRVGGEMKIPADSLGKEGGA